MSNRAHAPALAKASAALGLGAALALTAAAPTVQAQAKPAATHCAGGNTGITLAPGFCATVFADNLGNIRHMAFGPGGVLYANAWSGTYYTGMPVPADGFLIALQSKPGSHKANIVTHFGETVAQGSAGGTGIAVYKGFVYAEANDKIVRYALNGAAVPTGKPEVVLSGMPLGGNHPMHPFIIDPKGQIFVDMGTATNACQGEAGDRKPGIMGLTPCTEQETRGGTWKYDANKLGQVFSPKERYATGIRNGEGFAFDSAGRLFVTQHGRDQLPALWPKLYPDLKHATELPAEELMQLTAGGDYGWPTCYYDGFQQKLVLAPEYGGDGGKAVGVCATKKAPVAAFPAHWAPNDLAIYNAKAFPAPYQGGAFIAFHGSWNRAPEPQAGYNVVFQPMANGKASGKYIIFADGFTGGDPSKPVYRPMGLQVGPDGALYIADDNKGRIWRVTYQGGPSPVLSSAAAPKAAAAAGAGKPLPVPPGSTAAQVAEGNKLYHASSCAGCHGSNAGGSPVGPDLTSGKYLWGDGSVAALGATITSGVPTPKQYRQPMPPMGGAPLSPSNVHDMAGYIWAVAHQAK
jgi:glucose/arabinose dehydrogenase/cytochrome c5